ncbi:phage protein [Bacillus stratosphericus LAMA 585]|nr:phage protein [Bacillus stratosphericus LAMA 585]
MDATREDEQTEESCSERDTRNGSEADRGTRDRQGILGNAETSPQRVDGIDYLQVIEDAARWMGVYDNDLIMSWTPNEYKRKLKAAKLREIDEIERMTINAMFHRYANNAKKVKPSQMFDAQKARTELERDVTGNGFKNQVDAKKLNDLNIGLRNMLRKPKEEG